MLLLLLPLLLVPLPLPLLLLMIFCHRRHRHRRHRHRHYHRHLPQAKHSIYIENQFFISAIEGNNTVHNRISQALFDRIMSAIHAKQQFRVVIVVPFHADGPLHSEMVWLCVSVRGGGLM